MSERYYETVNVTAVESALAAVWLAVIPAVPAARPVTMPFCDTDATDGFEEAHVTVWVAR